MVNSANNNGNQVSSNAVLHLVHSDTAAGGEVGQNEGLLERVDAAEVLASVASGDLPYEVTEGLIGHLESVRKKIFQGGILVGNALERFRKTVGVGKNSTIEDVDDWSAEVARPLVCDDEHHPDHKGFISCITDMLRQCAPERLGDCEETIDKAYKHMSGIQGRLSTKIKNGLDNVIDDLIPDIDLPPINLPGF